MGAIRFQSSLLTMPSESTLWFQVRNQPSYGLPVGCSRQTLPTKPGISSALHYLGSMGAIVVPKISCLDVIRCNTLGTINGHAENIHSGSSINRVTVRGSIRQAFLAHQLCSSVAFE